MKNKTNKIKRKECKFLSLNERIQIEIQYSQGRNLSVFLSGFPPSPRGGGGAIR
ncbi:hypothetical protein HY061_00230 [Candidatus Azambacteria bacterium]|nr:hypothetical protein [Candidatus Azambacteria bacterium]